MSWKYVGNSTMCVKMGATTFADAGSDDVDTKYRMTSWMHLIRDNMRNNNLKWSICM